MKDIMCFSHCMEVQYYPKMQEIKFHYAKEGLQNTKRKGQNHQHQNNLAPTVNLSDKQPRIQIDEDAVIHGLEGNICVLDTNINE